MRGKYDGDKEERMTLRLPKYMIAKIDEEVKQDRAFNKSDFIRRILHGYFYSSTPAGKAQWLMGNKLEEALGDIGNILIYVAIHYGLKDASDELAERFSDVLFDVILNACKSWGLLGRSADGKDDAAIMREVLGLVVESKPRVPFDSNLAEIRKRAGEKLDKFMEEEAKAKIEEAAKAKAQEDMAKKAARAKL